MEINHINSTFNLSELVYNNVAFLGYVNVPNHILHKYAVILAFLPLSDKKRMVYKKLTPYNRAGFLYKHIILISRTLKVQEPVINNVLSLKKDFKITVVTEKSQTFNEDILNVLRNREYSKLSEEFDYWNNYENSKKNFLDAYSLLLSCILDILAKKNDRQLKLEQMMEG